jgi:hypothetical protein
MKMGSRMVDIFTFPAYFTFSKHLSLTLLFLVHILLLPPKAHKITSTRRLHILQTLFIVRKCLSKIADFVLTR